MDKKALGITALVALLVSGGVVLGVVLLGPSDSVVKEVKKGKEVIGAIPGNTLPNCVVQEGTTICRAGGSCTDRTSQGFNILNPTEATSTVRGRFQVANGTTTIGFSVIVGTTTAHAATTTAYTDYGPFGALVKGVEFTSLQNRSIIGGGTYVDANTFDAGTTTAEIIIQPTQTIQMIATGTLAGISNTNNVFSCNYNLEFRSLRN